MPPDHSAGSAPVAADKVRTQLARILRSDGFVNSGRMCKFLEFAVKSALAGETEKLKEYVIALEVFGRDASYDPRIDSVVRVEARRLRSKLKQYYESQGRDDLVFIGFRKGSYAPEIRFLPAASTPVSNVTPQPHAVAVLPFVNMSPEPDQDFFCDGLTEELIHCLAAAENLRVVAHTSTFQFKGKAYDVREIAMRLGVDTIIEGSVRKAGDHVRISAEIIDATTGFHRWSGSFDREQKDVLALQDEVSRTVADTLEIKLPSLESSRTAQRQFPSPEVFSAYLRGRYQANRQSLEALRRAVEQFEQIVRDHPTFALGHAGLAEAYGLLSHQGGISPAEATTRMKTAAHEALRLDPLLAEPHATLGGLLSFYEWRNDEATEYFKRAIELQPAYAAAHHWYGMHLLAFGRLRESRAELQCALELDPLSLHVGGDYGFCLYLQRDFDGAIRQYRKTLELEPDYEDALFGLAQVYCHLGEYDEALTFAKQGCQSEHENPLRMGLLGAVFGYAGRHSDARKILRKLDALSAHGYVPPLARVFVHAALGEWDSALKWLECAEKERATWMRLLKVDPRFDPIRNDRRFQALLARLDLLVHSHDTPL